MWLLGLKLLLIQNGSSQAWPPRISTAAQAHEYDEISQPGSWYIAQCQGLNFISPKVMCRSFDHLSPTPTSNRCLRR